MITEQEIIDFEEKIAAVYEAGEIRAPIHLRSGNEKQLINIFQNVDKKDYVFCTWASHAHALLKGVPIEQVEWSIMNGRSITLMFPEYKFYSSAIVGGTAPIAVGTAYALQKQQGNNRVYCFLGDMGFNTGITHESIKYSIGHDLPITFVVEDNGVSVCTDTEATWGMNTYQMYEWYCKLAHGCKNVKLEYYSYKSKYPHSGIGQFISF